MKAYRFAVAEHAEFGGLGLVPKWYPTGDPLGGMAAAHDILEHFPNDDGSTEGELQALGAAIWVRGEGGVTFDSHGGRYFDLERDIPADFPEIWRHHAERHNSRWIDKPPRCRDAELLARCQAANAGRVPGR